MARYHINNNDEPKECGAREPQRCQFYRGESDSRHFDTFEEAQTHSERLYEESFGVGGLTNESATSSDKGSNSKVESTNAASHLSTTPKPSITHSKRLTPSPAMVAHVRQTNPAKKHTAASRNAPKPGPSHTAKFLQGQFKKGNVKITPGQRKKHISQMSEREVKTVIGKLKTLKNPRPSRHLQEKIDGEGLHIDNELVNETLQNANENNIIEYNSVVYSNGGRSRRTLLRSQDSRSVYIPEQRKNVNCNLCFVVDMDKNMIVTSYWNATNDNHNNINWKRYDNSLDIDL